MRLLLDTHAFLWALLEPEKLTPATRELLQATSTDIVVSVASAWEITSKYRLGKLPGAAAVVDDYAAAIRGLQATELEIKRTHVLRAGSFPQAHRDPFDCMLAAQAEIEHLPIVSRDNAFAQFGVKLLW